VIVQRVRRRLARAVRQLRPAAPVDPAAAHAARAAKDVAGTTWDGGLPIPPPHLRFMQESDERFIATARSLTGALASNGLQPTSDVLDVGSGYGRLAVGLMDRSEFTGTYLGFDILERHVEWCTGVISAADGRFQFRHLDLLNERYNPTGTMDPSEAVFPAADSSVDVCALFSVFTHLYRPTIERYLQEIARVLRPGGVAVTSWLLFDDERLAAVMSDTSSYPLRLQGVDGSRFMLAEDPLRAIGFPEQDVVAMAGKAGLQVERIERGYWDTRVPANETSQFQDLVILSR
jgi:SAM-dependent methyltransferase